MVRWRGGWCVDMHPTAAAGMALMRRGRRAES